MPEYTWINENVFTVAELLSPLECQQYIDLAESAGFGDAPINTIAGAVRVPDVRNNSRVMLDDAARAADLWSRARDYVPLHRGNRVAVGANERLRIYRYDPGQQFDWHRDGYFERDNGERSLFTYMIYLNDGFTGGETSFEDLKITPQTGLGLLFLHPLLHKGEPVVTGRKYVLRTDIMYRSV